MAVTFCTFANFPSVKSLGGAKRSDIQSIMKTPLHFTELFLVTHAIILILKIRSEIKKTLTKKCLLAQYSNNKLKGIVKLQKRRIESGIFRTVITNDDDAPF
jgi:hypothetical protein